MRIFFFFLDLFPKLKTFQNNGRMRLISCFLIFNIFYSVNVLCRYVTLVSKRQEKTLSILFQSTMRSMYSESSPAAQHLTVMEVSFENYSLKLLLSLLRKDSWNLSWTWSPKCLEINRHLCCCSSLFSCFSYFSISRRSHFNALI